MKKWTFFFTTLLIVLFCVKSAFALEYLSKGDLNIDIEGLKGSYSPGEKLSVKITITPKSSDIAKRMENRDWTFYNYLNEPRNLEVTFVARETYVPYTKSTTKESLKFKDYEISSGYGVDKIEINISGYVPTIESGTEEFTFFKIVPQDGDTIVFNITIVNPSKLENDLKSLENELKEIKKEMDELGKYISVESLNERYDMIYTNLTLAKEYYNDKDYSKVSEKIRWIKNAINDLKAKLKEKKADYYLSEAKNLMNDIDALILKAESYITVAKSSGKSNEIIDIELNLTQIKYKVSDLKDDLKNVQTLYDNGKYDEVIDNAKDLIDKAKNVKLQLSVIVSNLQNVLSSKLTPTPTKSATNFNFKLDTKTLTYIGIGIAVIVGGSVAAIGISKWRQKRKWDELR